MRIFVRILLGAVFFAAIALMVYLLLGTKRIETWAVLTGGLAVVAAVIAIWPSLRVPELQEDATRPCPIPYFDIKSRFGLLLLQVKNFGVGVAYDVRLKWKNQPLDEKDKEVTVNAIPVLVPQGSVSVLIGRPHELLLKYPVMRFEGTVEFKDVTGKHMTQRFICSADEYRNSLTHDDELVKMFFELQQIPKQLDEISSAIKGIHH